MLACFQSGQVESRGSFPLYSLFPFERTTRGTESRALSFYLLDLDCFLGAAAGWARWGLAPWDGAGWAKSVLNCGSKTRGLSLSGWGDGWQGTMKPFSTGRQPSFFNLVSSFSSALEQSSEAGSLCVRG